MAVGRLAWELMCAAICLAVTILGAIVGIASGLWHVVSSTQASRLKASGPVPPDGVITDQANTQDQAPKLEDGLQQLHQELTRKLSLPQDPSKGLDAGDLTCPPSYVANWTPRDSMDSSVCATPDKRFSMDSSGPTRPLPHESGLPHPPHKQHRLHQEGRRHLPEE